MHVARGGGDGEPLFLWNKFVVIWRHSCQQKQEISVRHRLGVGAVPLFKIAEKHIVYPLFALCLFFCAVILLFYGTVLCGAFVKVWGVDNSITFNHFRYIFSIGIRPLKNAIMPARADDSNAASVKAAADWIADT